MSAQLSGLAYGHSLAYPRPVAPARTPGQDWDETGDAHGRMAACHWAAAYSCPEGKEQDWYVAQAVAEERAEARCRARAEEVRQSYRYPSRKVPY